ncbi:MAG: winged helix-turn-helix domain-containing protein [Verrucomicrobiae bacterium]|nr:winged helix-turn-helix domain-containing protein [Verrucomicrobiae bacterium]
MNNPVPKYVLLREALLQYIGEHRAGDLMPSYNEITRIHGVTQNTIDRVMMELEGSGMVVRQQGRGTFITEWAHSKFVALIQADMSTAGGRLPLYSMLMLNLQILAGERGLPVLNFFNIPDFDPAGANRHQQEMFESQMALGKITGIIMGSIATPQTEAWFRSRTLPFVSVKFGEPRPGEVSLDMQEVIRQGVGGLVTGGAQSVWLVPVTDQRVSEGNLFYGTLAESCRLHGLEAGVGQILAARDEGGSVHNYFETYGRAVAETFLASPRVMERRPGVVILDDLVTKGFLAGLRAGGVSPGKDVFIATLSFRGSPTLYGEEERMVRSEFNISDVASAMLDCLRALAGGPATRTFHVSPKIVLPI